MLNVLKSEKATSANLWPETRRDLLYVDARCTDMQVVEADVESVEARLRAGEIACVDCGGELRPWGYARRRTLRDHGRLVGLRPRRSRCRSCRVSHVLPPTLVLLLRVDLVAVIGAASGRQPRRRCAASDRHRCGRWQREPPAAGCSPTRAPPVPASGPCIHCDQPIAVSDLLTPKATRLEGGARLALLDGAPGVVWGPRPASSRQFARP
jgi:hypothetical protein